MNPVAAETALIVRVAAAEPCVAALRERHDPVARLGVPAHVTVLYPFVAPAAITADVIERTRRAVATVRSFRFRLEAIERFPDTVWLAPEPATPFVALTTAIARAFPSHPPYGGRFATIVPHLTVAHGTATELAAIERELRARLDGCGSIESECREIELIENTTGRWCQSRTFPLPPESTRP